MSLFQKTKGLARTLFLGEPKTKTKGAGVRPTGVQGRNLYLPRNVAVEDFDDGYQYHVAPRFYGDLSNFVPEFPMWERTPFYDISQGPIDRVGSVMAATNSQGVFVENTSTPYGIGVLVGQQFQSPLINVDYPNDAPVG